MIKNSLQLGIEKQKVLFRNKDIVKSIIVQELDLNHFKRCNLNNQNYLQRQSQTIHSLRLKTCTNHLIQSLLSIEPSKIYLKIKQINMKNKILFQQQQISSQLNNQEPVSKLLNSLQVQIIQINQELIEFNIIGIHASFANALRRIILSQIPTMAIHKVLIFQNTSIMTDQILAHRLGLIPIKCQPQAFQFKNCKLNQQEQDKDNGRNSIKFKLHIKCQKKKQFIMFTDQVLQKRGIKPQQYLLNHVVYSKDLIFQPLENQQNYNCVPVHPNIPIIKLSEGQQIILQCYCYKGIGKQHTKWSAVSTAFYRMMPHIIFKQKFKNKDAEQLIKMCPVDVFALEKKQCKVVNMRNCTMCRNCINGYPSKIELGKLSDHFICKSEQLVKIESVGIYRPQQILIEALKVLRLKCSKHKV